MNAQSAQVHVQGLANEEDVWVLATGLEAVTPAGPNAWEVTCQTSRAADWSVEPRATTSLWLSGVRTQAV